MAPRDPRIELPADFFANHHAQFISGLSNLESGVHELRRAYISHFNTLLPEGHPGRLSLPYFASFDANASAAAAAAGAPMGGERVATPPTGTAPTTEANVKKKRKPHDPNAPKRALTSYFLFMQHNKPEIKAANPTWDAKAVAEESERRWQNISEADKQKYEYMYQVDLARYYKQKEAYEAGEPVPEINAEQATALYNEHLKSGVPFKGRKGKKFEGFGAHPTTDAEGDSSEEEAAPPPKAKRQKKNAAAANTPSQQLLSQPPNPASGKAPTKKQQKEAAAAAAAQINAAAANANIAPAPPAPMGAAVPLFASANPSPEVPKKKSGGRKSKGGANSEPVPIAPMMNMMADPNAAAAAAATANANGTPKKAEKKSRKRKSAAATE